MSNPDDFEAAVQRELARLREIAGFKAPQPPKIEAPAARILIDPKRSLDPTPSYPQPSAPIAPPSPLAAASAYKAGSNDYEAAVQRELAKLKEASLPPGPTTASSASRFSAWDGASPSAAIGMAMPEPSMLAPQPSSSYSAPSYGRPAETFDGDSQEVELSKGNQAVQRNQQQQQEYAAPPGDDSSPFEFASSVGSRKGIGYGPTLRKAAPLPSGGPSASNSAPPYYAVLQPPPQLQPANSRRYALSELPEHDDGILLPPSAAQALEGVEERAARASKQASYAAALERQQREAEARKQAEQQQVARGRTLGDRGLLSSLDGGEVPPELQHQRRANQQQQQRSSQPPPPSVEMAVRIVGGKIKPVPSSLLQQPARNAASSSSSYPDSGSSSNSNYYQQQQQYAQSSGGYPSSSSSASSLPAAYDQPPPQDYDQRRYQ